MIYIAEIYSDRMFCLQLDRLEQHELVLLLWRSCNLVGSIETHYQDIDYQCVKLEDEGSEL